MPASIDGAAALRLPPVLDLSAATPLVEDFLARRGTGLVVDASDVRRLGAVCLQALLAAVAQWRRDGLEFRVIAASDAFNEALALFGAGLVDAEEVVA